MIVVDASVAVKWFLIEKETPDAMQVVHQILRGKDVFCVPELFYYEVFSVVMRKHQQPVQWAKSGMHWLLNLPLQRVPMGEDLSSEMSNFIARGLTGYDAAYAAIAQKNGGKWLTYDETARKLLSCPPWIISQLC